MKCVERAPSGSAPMLQLRPANTEDVSFLTDMLFEAFFWDPAMQRPALTEFRKEPEVAKLLAGWGRHGDRGMIAELDAISVGAAWFRLWTPGEHSYGYVSSDVPELGVAVAPPFRSRGIGRSLLQALIETARTDGFRALSLSVSPYNRARHLYESTGFHKTGESGTSWTLLLPLR